MAEMLEIENIEVLLPAIFEALSVKQPGQRSSVLVLDGMNWPGQGGCNIELIDGMMRYMAERNLGISLYVATQNKQMAQKFLELNYWQKIGPMEGLTDPTWLEVSEQRADVPGADEDSWTTKNITWTQRALTNCVLQRYPETPTNGDGLIPWLIDGMTPTEALRSAINRLEDEDFKTFDGKIGDTLK